MRYAWGLFIGIQYWHAPFDDGKEWSSKMLYELSCRELWVV